MICLCCFLKVKEGGGHAHGDEEGLYFTHHTIMCAIPWEKQKEVSFKSGVRCVDTLTLTPPRASDPPVTLKASDEVRYWADKCGKRKLWWAGSFFYHHQWLAHGEH